MQRITTIVSGGQTGADRAALDFALETGMKIQGYCPRNRKAEDGPLDPRYPLRETKSTSYHIRTRKNAYLGDATIIFNGLPGYSSGTRTTIRYAEKYGKKYVVLQGFPDIEKDAAELKEWLRQWVPTVLNVAGNGEEKCPGMYRHVLAVLRKTLR